MVKALDHWVIVVVPVNLCLVLLGSSHLIGRYTFDLKFKTVHSAFHSRFHLGIVYSCHLIGRYTSDYIFETVRPSICGSDQEVLKERRSSSALRVCSMLPDPVWHEILIMSSPAIILC